ncbi:cupin domain-containing protein [Staphylococcus caeli]|uniref:Cupin superfamily protein n=1 Tax=Staphylococcus caeli TaxID=2201815 RepID=A0A1D4HSY7_9STAP|nr:cupin domain-containing protein [Staphylococcus caeli]SCS26097.1 cupin superfamily protein [Staphylococcus caeli]SCS40333.1 cupin superfamily protein [Staphylococcus caeli]
MKQHIENWITQLQLQPHPEGGYYKEIIKGNAQGQGTRAAYSSIYFLLTFDNISHFHRIDADEIWYYHAGDSLTVHMIGPEGQYSQVTIGQNIEAGDVLQYVVPKGTIFASSVEGENDYALVGCMCQPGFEFEHFELMSQSWLNEQYPHLKEIHKRYALTDEAIENANK